MKHGFVIIVFLILMMITCSGCWDMVELDQRTIIAAIGIDKGENPGVITLTLQSLINSKLTSPTRAGGGGGAQERAVRVVSIQGKTIHEALAGYRQQTNFQPYLQDNQLLIIGEALARDGVGPIIDFFMRSPASRTRAHVLVAKGKAGDILKWQSEEHQISAEYIEEMINSKNLLAPLAAVDLHQFILNLSNPSMEPTTSGIEILPKQDDRASQVRITDAAVFKKDRLVGWLNRQETNGLLWIINRYHKGILEITGTGKPGQNTVLTIFRTGTKIEPESNDGPIRIKIKITAKAILDEMTKDLKLTDEKVMQALEKKAAAVINREVHAALKKCQTEFKSDVFGFGAAVERHFPQSWKSLQPGWPEEFSRIPVLVVSKVKINGTGILMDPVMIK